MSCQKKNTEGHKMNAVEKAKVYSEFLDSVVKAGLSQGE